jgi:hypothetical protein
VQVTNKSRDSGQGTTDQVADHSSNLKQRKAGTQKIKANKSKNLKQHRLKIQKLRNRLYALGFTERALEDLQNLVTDSPEPILQSTAARQLAFWYADQYSEEGVRQCLELLPVALQGKNDPVRVP